MSCGITKSIAENCADITGYALGSGKGNEIMQSIAKIGEEVKERQKKEMVFFRGIEPVFPCGGISTRGNHTSRATMRALALLWHFYRKGER